jgi:hypothetical protein
MQTDTAERGFSGLKLKIHRGTQIRMKADRKEEERTEAKSGRQRREESGRLVDELI